MRTILIIAFCFFIGQAFSQTVTKYFDSTWGEVPKEQAFYKTDFVKDGDVYQCTSYWANSGKLYATSIYSDTNFTKGIGIQKRYYESGKMLDSIVFDDKGRYKSFDEFTEEGKQKYHAFYDEKGHDIKAVEFDEKGNKKPGYITFQKQAMFPGGADGWVNYLQTHLKADVPTRKKAPVGNYTVMVSFLVDKQGKISEVKAETNPGYGTAEEAVRVIKNGPDWLPAIQNNHPVIYRQKQTITFQVIEGKK